MFGIGHTVNTRVGDDFVRGISGGERKRVTIAEATLSFAPLQCYDNSTRGTYIAFTMTVKLTTIRTGFCKCSRVLQDTPHSVRCVRDFSLCGHLSGATSRLRCV